MVSFFGKNKNAMFNPSDIFRKGGGGGADAILLEIGDFLLLENGDKLLLE